MKAATKTTYLKQSNLNIIKKSLHGSKLFAYMRLLNIKGVEITEGKYKGGKFTTYSNGCVKAQLINGIINN